MSVNENIEFKVDEIKDAIKDLSEQSSLSSSQLNQLLDNLVIKIEEANNEGLTNFSSEFSEALSKILDNKYSEIEERFSLFEEFITEVGKNNTNSKIENEINRVLNDIEALHSKMGSQELQIEGVSKGLENIKNSSNYGQLSKVCDDIASISKSYESIGEILDNNFKEFLRSVEALGARDEIQRLRYNIENIGSNQNVLVSAMNTINEKQEEVKNIIKQSSSSQSLDKLEQIQNALNQMNRFILETTSKADLEIVGDKIASISNSIMDLKRAFDENKESGVLGVLSGQLNNIIAQLETLKMNSNSNVSEDIIRLYTSIAEFKDSIYSSMNGQLNDIVASIDAQFDKIANSYVSVTMDTNENVNNLNGEIQKLNSVVIDGINSKISEVKEDIQKQGHENITTIVNSIKGELNSLFNELSFLNNSESITGLAKSIENLKDGLDINSLIVQIDQIKQALDFTPIKEELALLNKDEKINSINDKLNAVLNYLENADILNKLDKISKELNLSGIENLIHEKIDNISPNIEKMFENSKGDIVNSISSINEKIDAIPPEVQGMIENSKISFENALSRVGEKINELNLRLDNDDNEILSEMKDQLSGLYEYAKNMSANPISEQIAVLKEQLSGLTSENFNDIQENLLQFRDNLSHSIEFIKTNLNETLDKSVLSDFFEPLLSDMLVQIESKIDTLEESYKSGEENLSALRGDLSEALDLLEVRLKNYISSASDEAMNEKVSKMMEILKANFNDIDVSTANNLKKEIEELKVYIRDGQNSLKEEALFRIAEIVEESEKSKEKTGFKNGVAKSLSDILSNTRAIKEGFEANSDFVNELNQKIDSTETKIVEAVKGIGLAFNEAELKETLIEKSLEIKKLLTVADGNISALKASFSADIPTKADFAELVGQLRENAEDIKAEVENISLKSEDRENSLSEFANLIEEKIGNKIAILEEIVDDSVNKINQKASEMSSDYDGVYGSVLEEKLREIAEDLKINAEERFDNLQKVISENILNKKLECVINQLKEEYDDRLEEFKVQVSENITNILNENNASMKEEFKYSSDSIVSEIANNVNKFADAQKVLSDDELDNKIQNILNILKKDYEEKYAAIRNIVNDNFTNMINDNNTTLKEEMKNGSELIANEITNNMEKLSYVQKNSYISFFDEKFEQAINQLKENYEEKIIDIQNLLGENTIDEKLEILVNRIKDDFQTKLSEIQTSIAGEILDEKFKIAINKLKESYEEKIIDIQNLLGENTIDEKLTGAINQIKEHYDNKILNILNILSSNTTDKKIEALSQKINEELQEKATYILKALSHSILDKKNETVINQLKEEFQAKVSDIQAMLGSNMFDDRITDAVNQIKENNNEKISNIEYILGDGSIDDKLDNLSRKLSEIFELKLSDIKSSLENEILDEKFKIAINKLKESYEEKIIDIQNLLGENTIDEKLTGAINQIKDNFDEKFIDFQNILGENTIDEKFENTISRIKNENEIKFGNIEKALSNILTIEDFQNAAKQLNKNYENRLSALQKLMTESFLDILSRNNDVLKDEFKYNSDVLTREVTALVEKLNKANEEAKEKEEGYTIKDVEADLAKIRLAQEKTNKLTNFKEFASRLVELKNINLENAKISRVIGADIMRFDGWLKNTTAKIELLAAKIDKSEKIKMEDLKSRLIQSEKNQAMPQKVEDTVMSIYKKYRAQETKVDDLINKIDILSGKQTDTFDTKEFIDLFYDTTKKQESLMSRMDSMEDKMDLIQAKLDHIISTCIDGADE